MIKSDRFDTNRSWPYIGYTPSGHFAQAQMPHFAMCVCYHPGFDLFRKRGERCMKSSDCRFALKKYGKIFVFVSISAVF